MLTVSFHSYKGGSCRTTTCANTIPFLALALNATPEKPIIVVDADLDSLGITNILAPNSFRGTYLDAQKLFKNDPPISFFDRRIDSFENNQYFKHFKPVGARFGLENETVRLLGVNDLNRSTNLEGNRDTFPLTALKNALMENNKVTAIVFDCASGEQTSAIMALNVSDVMVCCLRPTSQFREGTFNFLNNQLPLFHTANNTLNVILVPTAVPLTTSVLDLRKDALDSLDNKINFVRYEWNKQDGNLILNDAMIDHSSNEVGIPEIESFKWAESILHKKIADKVELRRDEILASKVYEKLATIIAKYNK